jgi:predicted cupin superfamily sugar epimerase
MFSAAQIIDLLHLEPLQPEGGFYRETYRSARHHSDGKSFATAIYYLLTAETCSLLHRLPGDEVYHFYLGSPVELLLLEPSAAGRIVTLGHDLVAGEQPQFTVHAGVWQGSCLAPGGTFALLGTTMAPGFDFRDYEPGERAKLLRDYPLCAGLIERLTPDP